MGQAALFTPPPIHRTNLVILPNYLLKSRLKQFCKLIDGEYAKSDDGLITVMNDYLEFHFKTFHRYIELTELTLNDQSKLDAVRCLEFIKYESYLFQKPVYASDLTETFSAFLKEHGFRILNAEEDREARESFWELDKQKAQY